MWIMSNSVWDRKSSDDQTTMLDIINEFADVFIERRLSPKKRKPDYLLRRPGLNQEPSLNLAYYAQF